MAEPIVTLKQGKLLGTVKQDLYNNNFYSFQGIPYAKPPLGKLRFKAPQPPENWEGVRDARKEGSECYSKQFNVITGSEDCLFLNVFTKQVSSKERRPVMVWIHGGGFTTGSSRSELYGPEYLISQDIVLVTFNYRLGVLGFLSLSDSSLEIPGNAGLKDMVMVLKWVQENIAQFCGDPDNVTIFGESAGGASVHFLMLSAMAAGLFHKAIAQSGSALNIWCHSGRNGVHLLAEALGIHSSNEEVILEHLQKLPVDELFRAAQTIGDPFLVGKTRPFVPTIEKTTSEPTFLSKHPLDIIKSGNYNKVPFLTGCCSREGMFIYGLCTNSKENLLLVDQSIVPYTLNIRERTELYKHVVGEIKQFYFRGKDPKSDVDSIYRLYTDNFFQYEMYNAVRRQLDTSKTPIFYYRFSLDTKLNFMKSFNGFTDPGVYHGDDLFYLFKNIFTSEFDPDSAEEIGIRKMIKLWSNFAKFGDPTPVTEDPLLPIKWAPISKEKFNCLDIAENFKLLDEHPEKKAMEFWDKLYEMKVASKL